MPPFLVALRLLVVGPRLPRAARAGAGAEEREGAVAFSVISIEPERSPRRWGSASRRPGLEEARGEEEAEVDDGGRGGETRAYEDENEIHWQQVRRSAREVESN